MTGPASTVRSVGCTGKWCREKTRRSVRAVGDRDHRVLFWRTLLGSRGDVEVRLRSKFWSIEVKSPQVDSFCLLLCCQKY